MRVLVLFIWAAGLLGQQSQMESRSRLVGCPDPSEVVKAVAKLRGKDWQEVTVARLQELWPVRLEVLQREVGKFALVGSQGRIIYGQCQCCESFDFKLKELSDGTQSEQLTRLIVKYSSAKRTDVVSVAKELARGTGLRENDVATIGRQQVQDFGWQDAQGQETFALELHFTEARGVWTAHVTFARYPLKP